MEKIGQDKVYFLIEHSHFVFICTFYAFFVCLYYWYSLRRTLRVLF